jgi:hypothetical protein
MLCGIVLIVVAGTARLSVVPATMKSRLADRSDFRYCDAVGPIVKSFLTSLTPLVCCATC